MGYNYLFMPEIPPSATRVLISCVLLLPPNAQKALLIWMRQHFPLHNNPDSNTHGANMRPAWTQVGPCWTHEPCYLGTSVLYPYRMAPRYCLVLSSPSIIYTRFVYPENHLHVALCQNKLTALILYVYIYMCNSNQEIKEEINLTISHYYHA